MTMSERSPSICGELDAVLTRGPGPRFAALKLEQLFFRELVDIQHA